MPVLFAEDFYMWSGVTLAAVAAVIVVILMSPSVFRVWKTNQELNFKRDMLENGMSVDEVERVLRAGQGAEGK